MLKPQPRMPMMNVSMNLSIVCSFIAYLELNLPSPPSAKTAQLAIKSAAERTKIGCIALLRMLMVAARNDHLNLETEAPGLSSMLSPTAPTDAATPFPQVIGPLAQMRHFPSDQLPAIELSDATGRSTLVQEGVEELAFFTDIAGRVTCTRNGLWITQSDDGT